MRGITNGRRVGCFCADAAAPGHPRGLSPPASSAGVLWFYARTPIQETRMAKAATASLTPSSATLDRHQLLAALRAFRKGDFSVRLPIGLTGIDGEIGDAFNDVVELNESLTKELERLGDVVGKEGKIGHRA